MGVVHFVTHPEVVIDPAMPVPDWRLSAVGVRRTALMLRLPWVAGVRAVFSSAERKAREVAAPLGAQVGAEPVVLAELGENDRSATGYLPRAVFEAMADRFFAEPAASVAGWERAADAQARIVAAVASAVARSPRHGDVAVVSHGGVGALLLCHLKRVPISRAEDQPGEGGGNVYSFDAGNGTLLSGWRRMEDAW